MRAVDDVVAEVPVWAGAANVRVELLNGGLTNHTYKVIADGAAYVLRLNGQQSGFIGLDPAQEALAISTAHELGLAPKVCYLAPQRDYLVTEFVAGRLVSDDDAHKPEFIGLLARTLAKLHSIGGVDRHCTPYDIIERQVSALVSTGGTPSPEVAGHLAHMSDIRKRHAGIAACAPAFCHNDAYHINMLFDGDRITMIDWELCGYGDVYLDLAVFPYVFAYTEEEERALLTAYFGHFEPEQLEPLHNMRFIGMLREVVWAELHATIEPNPVNHSFDYRWFADHVLTRLREGRMSLWG